MSATGRSYDNQQTYVTKSDAGFLWKSLATYIICPSHCCSLQLILLYTHDTVCGLNTNRPRVLPRQYSVAVEQQSTTVLRCIINDNHFAVMICPQAADDHVVDYRFDLHPRIVVTCLRELQMCDSYM